MKYGIVIMSLVAATLIVAFLTTGCTQFNGCRQVDALDGTIGLVLEEYVEYVEADSALDEETKALRKNTAAKGRELLDEMKELCHGED